MQVPNAVYTIFAGLSLASPIMPVQEAREAERPNFVLIIADDMGYADCGANGHKTIKTPNIPRIGGRTKRLRPVGARPQRAAP
jgi:hypothetical protein